MANRATPNIGDDLHIPMRMRIKPGVRLDHIVIDHEKLAEAHLLRIVITGKTEVMLGVKPAVIGATKRFIGIMADHLSQSPVWR